MVRLNKKTFRWEDNVIIDDNVFPIVYWSSDEGHRIIDFPNSRRLKSIDTSNLATTHFFNLPPFYAYNTSYYSNLSRYISFMIGTPRIRRSGEVSHDTYTVDIVNRQDGNDPNRIPDAIITNEYSDLSMFPYIWKNDISLYARTFIFFNGAREGIRYTYGHSHMVDTNCNSFISDFAYTRAIRSSIFTILPGEFFNAIEFIPVSFFLLPVAGGEFETRVLASLPTFSMASYIGRKINNNNVNPFLYDNYNFYPLLEIRSWTIPFVIDSLDNSFVFGGLNLGANLARIETNEPTIAPDTSNILVNPGRKEDSVTICSTGINDTVEGSIISTPPIIHLNDDMLFTINSNIFFNMLYNLIDRELEIFTDDIDLEKVLYPINYFFRKEDCLYIDNFTFTKIAPDLKQYSIVDEDSTYKAELEYKDNTSLPVIVGAFEIKYFVDKNFYIQDEDNGKLFNYNNEDYYLKTIDINKIFTETKRDFPGEPINFFPAQHIRFAGFPDWQSSIFQAEYIDPSDSTGNNINVSFHTEGSPINNSHFYFGTVEERSNDDFRWQKSYYKILLPYTYDRKIEEQGESETDEEFQERRENIGCSKDIPSFVANGDDCFTKRLFEEATNIVPVSYSSENIMVKVIDRIGGDILINLKDYIKEETNTITVSNLTIASDSLGTYCTLPTNVFDVFASEYVVRRTAGPSHKIINRWSRNEYDIPEGVDSRFSPYSGNINRIQIYDIMKGKEAIHYYKWLRTTYNMEVSFDLIQLNSDVSFGNDAIINKIDIIDYDFGSATSTPFLLDVTLDYRNRIINVIYQVFINYIKLIPVNIQEVYSSSYLQRLTLSKALFQQDFSKTTLHYHTYNDICQIVLTKLEPGNPDDNMYELKENIVELDILDAQNDDVEELKMQIVANFDDMVNSIINNPVEEISSREIELEF